MTGRGTYITDTLHVRDVLVMPQKEKLYEIRVARVAAGTVIVLYTVQGDMLVTLTGDWWTKMTCFFFNTII